MEAAVKETLKIDKTNWTPVKFSDVVFEPKENAKDIYNEGIEHVVGLEHIDSENIHLTRSGKLEESTTFSKKFKKGDVLFGRRRAYLKKAALAGFDGICSGDITVFRAKKNLLPELLPFVVNNEKFFDYAVKHSAGGLSPRVKFKDLANYEFLLPPKDQQAQLAELLWAMDEVIEREIVFKRYIFDSKRSFFKNYRYASVYKPLSNFCSVSYGLGQPPPKDENGISMIRATDICKGKINTSNFLKVSSNGIPKGRNVQLKKGDIVIVRSGAYTGDLAMITEECEGAIAGYDLVIRSDERLINTIWLQEYLLEREAQNYFSGESIRSAQPHLNSKQVMNTLIPFHSIDIQNRVSETLIAFYDCLEKLDKKIVYSQSLQKSLINQIF
jgi:type I restriction enzyme, S subunit